MDWSDAEPLLRSVTEDHGPEAEPRSRLRRGLFPDEVGGGGWSRTPGNSTMAQCHWIPNPVRTLAGNPTTAHRAIAWKRFQVGKVVIWWSILYKA